MKKQVKTESGEPITLYRVTAAVYDGEIAHDMWIDPSLSMPHQTAAVLACMPVAHWRTDIIRLCFIPALKGKNPIRSSNEDEVETARLFALDVKDIGEEYRDIMEDMGTTFENEVLKAINELIETRIGEI